MKSLLVLVSLLAFSTSAFAVDITCKNDPKNEFVFPEAPITIKLGLDTDKLSMEGDRDIYETKSLEEDRLRWKVQEFEDAFGIKLIIDARKQVMELYDLSEGKEELKQTQKLICENVEEAEQEYISHILTPGKLEAAGMPRDLYVLDSARDALDLVTIPVIDLEAAVSGGTSK